MPCTRARVVVAALVLVGLPLSARADFYTLGNEFVLSNRLPNGDHYGYYAIWTNDGRGRSVSPGEPFPQAGQVQFNYSISGQPVGKDYPMLLDLHHQVIGPMPVYGPTPDQSLRVDGFAFNTDLHLSPSQIILPPGWTLKQNGQVAGFGTFSWVAMASNLPSFVNYGTISIDGLGSDATPAHFALTSVATPGEPPPSGMVYAGIHLSGLAPSALDNFATEHWIGVATLAAPEPASLSLAVLGLGAFGLLRALRPRSRGTSRP